MNVNTVLLAILTAAVVAGVGVYLNDRFNPTTPEELMMERLRQHEAECANVTGFSERIARGCD